MFIFTSPICFAVTKFIPADSIHFSVSASEPGTKSEIFGDVWQVAPESKIQLVSFELSTKYLLGISTLEYVCDIDAYIFRE